jgi:hypothetical protein
MRTHISDAEACSGIPEDQRHLAILARDLVSAWAEYVQGQPSTVNGKYDDGIIITHLLSGSLDQVFRRHVSERAGVMGVAAAVGFLLTRLSMDRDLAMAAISNMALESGELHVGDA